MLTMKTGGGKWNGVFVTEKQNSKSLVGPTTEAIGFYTKVRLQGVGFHSVSTL